MTPIDLHDPRFFAAPPDLVVDTLPVYARGSGRHRCYWPAPFDHLGSAPWFIQPVRGSAGWLLIDRNNARRFRTDTPGKKGVVEAVRYAIAAIAGPQAKGPAIPTHVDKAYDFLSIAYAILLDRPRIGPVSRTTLNTIQLAEAENLYRQRHREATDEVIRELTDFIGAFIGPFST